MSRKQGYQGDVSSHQGNGSSECKMQVLMQINDSGKKPEESTKHLGILNGSEAGPLLKNSTQHHGDIQTYASTLTVGGISENAASPQSSVKEVVPTEWEQRLVLKMREIFDSAVHDNPPTNSHIETVMNSVFFKRLRSVCKTLPPRAVVGLSYTIAS